MRRASSFRLLPGALAPGCVASWIRFEGCITCFPGPRFHDVMLLLMNGPNQNIPSKPQGSSPPAFRAWGGIHTWPSRTSGIGSRRAEHEWVGRQAAVGCQGHLGLNTPRHGMGGTWKNAGPESDLSFSELLFPPFSRLPHPTHPLPHPTTSKGLISP